MFQSTPPSWDLQTVIQRPLRTSNTALQVSVGLTVLHVTKWHYEELSECVTDPLCGPNEACSEPACVSLEQGAIKQETVVLPFKNAVSKCLII